MTSTRQRDRVKSDVAGDLAATSLFLARRLSAGGTLWCWSPRWPHHARHVAVEFVHPVIVGKRALPAVTVTGGDGAAPAPGSTRPGDVVVAIGPGPDRRIDAALREAGEYGLGTIWIGTGERPGGAAADELLWIDDDPAAPYDGALIRLYHVLWELAHVCFEHPGLFQDGRPPAATATEPTGFLYPFLEVGEVDERPLLVDLALSAAAKAHDSRELFDATVARLDGALDGAARALGERFGAGGRLFTFGNGGSSTDAAGLADLFSRPPAGPPRPARSLAADEAVLTALANDIGFESVFARQLIAHATPGDVALGISTSGNSANLLAGFAEARRRELLTIGLAGYDGGAMATCGDVEHLLVVASQSIHRVQEVQAGLGYELWSRLP